MNLSCSPLLKKSGGACDRPEWCMSSERVRVNAKPRFHVGSPLIAGGGGHFFVKGYYITKGKLEWEI
ncbi:MAG: hypothetical protein MW690_000678 [Methanophagales archaeon]|nr:hypothetical protein [Methanophagales archaeon]